MRKNFFRAVAAAVFTLFSLVSAVSRSGDADPVLNFYVSQAESTFADTDMNNSTLKYSFLAATYHKSIGNKGMVSQLDSNVIKYFCTGASVDSFKVLVAPKGEIPGITFLCPNVFTNAYDYNFFPNDVGEQDLAIGFDNYAYSDTLPTGIAVVDRAGFYLRRLYLYYPHQEGYKRLTRSFRFTDFSGHIFPDSIWEVGAKEGIFTAKYYRLETGIGQIQLLH